MVNERDIITLCGQKFYVDTCRLGGTLDNPFITYMELKGVRNIHTEEKTTND